MLDAIDRPHQATSEIHRIVVERSARLTVLDPLPGIAAFIVVIHHCLLTQPDFQQLLILHLAD